MSVCAMLCLYEGRPRYGWSGVEMDGRADLWDVRVWYAVTEVVLMATTSFDVARVLMVSCYLWSAAQTDVVMLMGFSSE